jgi:hypothetical protein
MVPPGLIDDFLPLDHFVFGAIKDTCRFLYLLHCDYNPAAATDQEIAAAFLIEAWEAVSTAVLDNVCLLYKGRDESTS